MFILGNNCKGDSSRKNILCLAPLSPPVTGASLASETIINFLKQHHEVDVIPYQRGTLISGKFSMQQLLRTLGIGIRLGLKRKQYDTVYLVNSSSLWGNKRDLFFLMMMGRRLRQNTVLHRHGANFADIINTSSPVVRWLNKKLLAEVRTAIVLGETLKNIFNGYVRNKGVRIVNNFFSPDLLIPAERVAAKFSSVETVKVLFLGNLIKEKGYEILLDAFLSLPEEVSRRAELHFAGECYSSEEREAFLNKIRTRENIYLHGPVAGTKKKELFWNAHVFCLPTYHMFEGQPISILEAYASGCIVLTTENGGIKDIFKDQLNGHSLDVNLEMDMNRLKERLKFEVKEKLMAVIPAIANYKSMAYSNRGEAMSKYTMEGYCKNIEKILIDGNARQKAQSDSLGILSHPGKGVLIKISPYKIPVKRNRILALIIHLILKACFSVSQVLTLKCFKDKDALEINKIRKMLIIRTDGIGDVVMSTPAFKALRDIFPNAHIVLLAGRWSRELVEVMPSFNEVVYFDAPWVAKENKDMRAFIRIIKKLRSEKFDLVIDLRGDFRNIILMYMLNIKHRLGFDITGCGFLLTYLIPCSDNHHPVNLSLSLIEHFIFKDKQKYNLSLEVTETDQNIVDVFLDENNIAYENNEDLIVVIHPGAKWYGRRWKEKCWAQIANLLIEKYNSKVIITGGPKDFELMKNIKDLMKYTSVVTPLNSSLRHFLSVLNRSKLFIGVDSGPMHMAAAMNVKVVAILGPARSEAIGPYGKEHIIVTKQQNYSCCPCSQTRCKIPENNCVEAVTAEEVWEAVELQMNKILSQKTVTSRQEKGGNENGSR